MALASTPTLLPLSKYFEIMGINPFVATASCPGCVDQCPDCAGDYWYPQPWQSGGDSVAIETLARNIAEVEREFKEYLGCPVAPDWICEEYHLLEGHYRYDVVSNWQRQYASNMHGWYGRNHNLSLPSANYPTITLKNSCLIEPGRRTLDEIELAADVVYSDENGDGYSETATITINDVAVTNECEVKVYIAGKGGDPAWEIRPLTDVIIDGTTLTIVIDSLLLIGPDLRESLCRKSRKASKVNCPDDTIDCIDICDADSFVITVDVYREYASGVPVEFLYRETECGCNSNSCVLNQTDGCLIFIDPTCGLAVPMMATLDEDTGEWITDCSNLCGQIQPFAVKVWYRAGCTDACGVCYDEVCYAQAIAYMATARFTSSVCACGMNKRNLTNWLRQDLARNRNEFDLKDTFFDNPFGTRQGEIYAWRKLMNKVAANVRGFAV